MHSWDIHIVRQIIWRKKLEEYDEIHIFTYFETQFGQIVSLDVYLFSNNIVCM